MSNKAVFLDRDGTIIFDHGYIKDPSLVNVLPKAKDAIDVLKKDGFMIFIVTNQSGVGRGMMTISDVNNVNKELLNKLSPNSIQDILICYHAPKDNCNCRKPKTGLIDTIIKKYDIDTMHSYSIGDKDSDKALGENIGGKGIKLGEKGIKDLWDAAILISSKK